MGIPIRSNSGGSSTLVDEVIADESFISGPRFKPNDFKSD
jgi:hypothetical protein